MLAAAVERAAAATPPRPGAGPGRRAARRRRRRRTATAARCARAPTARARPAPARAPPRGGGRGPRARGCPARAAARPGPAAPVGLGGEERVQFDLVPFAGTGPAPVAAPGPPQVHRGRPVLRWPHERAEVRLEGLPHRRHAAPHRDGGDPGQGREDQHAGAVARRGPERRSSARPAEARRGSTRRVLSDSISMRDGLLASTSGASRGVAAATARAASADQNCTLK